MDKWIRKVLLCLDWRNMSGTGRLESQEWEHLGSEGGEGGIEGPKIKIGDPTWVTANRAVLVATETETDRDHFTRIVTEFVICILSKPQSI